MFQLICHDFRRKIVHTTAHHHPLLEKLVTQREMEAVVFPFIAAVNAVEVAQTNGVACVYLYFTQVELSAEYQRSFTFLERVLVLLAGGLQQTGGLVNQVAVLGSY